MPVTLTSMDPFSIAAAAISIGSSIVGSIQGHDAQKDAARQNKKNSQHSYAETVAALNLRGVQESEQTVQTLEQAEQQGMTEQGLATVGAVAAGVAGNSVAAQSQVIDRGLATFRDSSLLNLDRMLSQIEQEKRGAYATMQSRIQSVQAPSDLATGLNVTSAFASGIDDLLTRRRPTTR